ncbi:MAG TPA: type VI-B CRISPR-associated RNA-guided ribonuclease Cas13b, partial [Saprospiraceae bacterium]|nr:type VI-B CRISPR-associated RNA-guided ribonuclease Cas13b [Saprospiraceae bacterium]
MEKNSLQDTTRTKDDVLYFGSYLNMGRHNVYLIINHVTEVFKHLGFRKLNDDEDIWSEKEQVNEGNILLNIFDPKKEKYQDERFRVFNYLIKRHHLPFLRIFTNQVLNDSGEIQNPEKKDMLIDFEGAHVFINKIFRELNEFRNSYTHYLSLSNEGTPLPKKLQINVELIKDLKTLFYYAPEFSFIRHNVLKQESKEEYETKVKAYYNDIRRKYRLFEGDESAGKLTDQGLFFFVNLFLERSNAIKFLKRFRGFKNETLPPFKATIQSFTTYALKIPDVRLDNDFPKQALLMEILTELNRCPKELYQVLGKEDKAKFDPKLEQSAINNILENVNYDELSDEHLEQAIKELVVLKRHDDRFPYFALRYLDEMNLLSQIRFQVYLGKVELKSYFKDDLGIERRILKPIYAFGKLSDFDNKEEDILRELKKNLPPDCQDIHWDQYKPHYNISQNNIPFYIFNDTDPKVLLPRLPIKGRQEDRYSKKPAGFLSIHSLPKFVITFLVPPLDRNGEKKIIEFVKSTNGFILNYENIENLQNKIQYAPETFTRRMVKNRTLLNKEKKVCYVTKSEIEDLTKKCEISFEDLMKLSREELSKKYKNLSPREIEVFSQYKYEHMLASRKEILMTEVYNNLPDLNLEFKYLPGKIRDKLLKIKTDEKKLIKNRIKSEISHTRYLVKKADNASKTNTTLKLGEMATELARDITRMVIDENIKKKITNPYANRLQNLIAYFSLNKNEIVQLLMNELKLFDTAKGHVFLTRELIEKSTGVLDFYINYFNKKIEYFDATFKVFLASPSEYEFKKALPLKYVNLIKKTFEFDTVKWFAHKNNMPVNIPFNLFDNLINNKLKYKIRENTVKMTFSKLLEIYVKYDCQPFYKFNREYNSVEKDQTESINILLLSSKDIQKNFSKRAVDNEKQIRFTQAKDRILKLMIEQLIVDSGSVISDIDFNLEDIYPGSEQSALNSPAEFRHKLKRQGNNGEEFLTVVAKDSESQIRQIKEWGELPKAERKIWNNLKSKEEKEEFLKSKNDKEKLTFNAQQWYQWTNADFGRFRRFLKDKRIPKLSKYFESKTIPFDLLEYQLFQYTIYREKMFDKVFELEKRMSELF